MREGRDDAVLTHLPERLQRRGLVRRTSSARRSTRRSAGNRSPASPSSSHPPGRRDEPRQHCHDSRRATRTAGSSGRGSFSGSAHSSTPTRPPGRSSSGHKFPSHNSDGTTELVAPRSDDHLLRPNEAAAMFGVHTQTLTRWANADLLPVLTTPNGHRRYRLGEASALLSGVHPKTGSRRDRRYVIRDISAFRRQEQPSSEQAPGQLSSQARLRRSGEDQASAQRKATIQ
jgi:DNA-binding transcriptional MerR regulator